MAFLGLDELRILVALVQVQLVAQDLVLDLVVLLLQDIPKVGLLFRYPLKSLLLDRVLRPRLVQGLLFLGRQLLLHVHRWRVLHRRLGRLLSSALALIDVWRNLGGNRVSPLIVSLLHLLDHLHDVLLGHRLLLVGCWLALRDLQDGLLVVL